SFGVAATTIAIGLAPSLGGLYAAVGFFGLFVGGVDASMNMQGVAVQRRYGRSILASCHAWWSVAGIAGAPAASQAHALPRAAFLGAAGGVGLLLSVSAGPTLLKRHAEQVADASPEPVLGPAEHADAIRVTGIGAPHPGASGDATLSRPVLHVGRLVWLVGL